MLGESPSDLEASAAELLAAAAPDPEYPVLSERQLLRRRGREVPLEAKATEGGSLLDVLPSLGGAPDTGLVNWSEVESRLDAAGLTREERAILLLHECHELPDWQIARVFGWDRKTIQRRRLAAADKLQQAAAKNS